MPSIDRTVEYDATPDAIWAVVSDLPKWPEWLTILKEWTTEPPVELAVGTALEGAITIMGVPMAVSWTVDACAPRRDLTISGIAVLNSKVTLMASIEPTGSASTLQLEVQVANAMLVGPLADTLMNAVRKDVDASLENFRSRL